MSNFLHLNEMKIWIDRPIDAYQLPFYFVLLLMHESACLFKNLVS